MRTVLCPPGWGYTGEDSNNVTKPHSSRYATSCILLPGRKPRREQERMAACQFSGKQLEYQGIREGKNPLHDYFLFVDLQKEKEKKEKKSQALSSMKSYWDNRDGIATADSNIYKGIMSMLHSVKPEAPSSCVKRDKMSHLGQVGIVPRKITTQV